MPYCVTAWSEEIAKNLGQDNVFRIFLRKHSLKETKRERGGGGKGAKEPKEGESESQKGARQPDISVRITTIKHMMAGSLCTVVARKWRGYPC